MEPVEQRFDRIVDELGGKAGDEQDDERKDPRGRRTRDRERNQSDYGEYRVGSDGGVVIPPFPQPGKTVADLGQDWAMFPHGAALA